MTPEPSGTRLVVVTYNIHSCVGRDRRKDPARTAQVLRGLGADVIGLQEVESHEAPGVDSHQLDFLREETGYRGVAGPTIEKPEGHYGNALLTRCAILDIQRHDLSVPRREPRGALEVLLGVRGARARFVVTHFGLGPSERRAQVGAMLEILARDENTPVVLLGDFNEWFPWSRSRRRLRRRLGDIPMPATFPAWRPIFALDHVWARPHEALQSLETVDDPLSRIASDHLPVRARINLDAAPE